MYLLFEHNLKDFKNQSGIYYISICGHTYVGSSMNIYLRLDNYKRAILNPKSKSVLRKINPILLKSSIKYGTSCVKFAILEYSNKNILLQKEKYWIELLKPNCNFKLDPTTQENCVTTSKMVYQFTLEGVFIKQHISAASAERECNIHGISAICRGKGKSAGGYLWSYDKKVLPYINNSKFAKIKEISIVDLEKNNTIKFKSIADCSNYLINTYGNKYSNFDSLCAILSGFQKGKSKSTKYNIRIDGNVIP